MACLCRVTIMSAFPFLVSGNKVWAFSGYDLVQGYPKSISSFGLPKTVKKIDAALHSPETGKTFFFVGSNYYRCVSTRSEIRSESRCLNCVEAEQSPHAVNLILI